MIIFVCDIEPFSSILATDPEFKSILLLLFDAIETLPSNKAMILDPSAFTSETHSVPLIDATAFGDFNDILTGILFVLAQILPTFKFMDCFFLGFFSKNKVEFLVTLV